MTAETRDELILRHLDGETSAEEAAQVKRLLAEDNTFRSRFFTFVNQTAGLRLKLDTKPQAHDASRAGRNGTAPQASAKQRPAALAEAMQRAHYPLQALLYLAALHRYLRARLPGYDGERHLAGVFYLFLRGMTGPAAPRIAGQPCGVFAWRPPAALVEALSDLLDRGGTIA